MMWNLPVVWKVFFGRVEQQPEHLLIMTKLFVPCLPDLLAGVRDHSGGLRLLGNNSGDPGRRLSYSSDCHAVTTHAHLRGAGGIKQEVS